MNRLFAAIVLLMGTTTYAAAPARVLTLPFDSVGDSPKPWIAKAIHQNLLTELARLSSVTPVSGDTPITEVSVAVRLGEGAHADFVVFGSYQTVEGDLRITGHVVDVAKKESIAGLKATGTQRDLFGLEDVIANQVKRTLPQPVVVQSDMLKQPVAPPPDAEPPAPEVAVNDRARELEAQIDRAIERLKYATPPDYQPYNYDYSYPYYGYSGIYQPFIYYTIPSYRFPIHHRGGFHGHPGNGGWHGGGGNWHGGGGNWHGGTGHGGMGGGGAVRVGGTVGVGAGGVSTGGHR